MTQSGPRSLILFAVVQEIEDRRQGKPWRLCESVGPMDYIVAKAFNQLIDCYFQSTLPREGAEKVELRHIAGAGQIVCDHTNQAERTWMIDAVEETDPHRIQSLRNVGGLVEPVLTGHDLKVRGLEFYSYPESKVAFLSQSPGDCVSRST